ncbi:MAG: 2OG-Fe(II) oxygenase [Pseudomonadales bacterium]|nr:2OG-Fe(II) oxygenase [Pseudomonadales bacterium]
MLPPEIIEFDDASIDNIADALKQRGYIILPKALSADLLDDLQCRGKNLPKEQWHRAGVGRHKNYQQNEEIRADKICWISADNSTESAFFLAMETLRLGLNRRLYLGLFDFECHFSSYAKGAYYRKHLDALKGQSNRVLSLILYLNTQWQATDGGALLLYPQQGGEPIQKIMPELGTLVLFLSETFPHEVLESQRQRLSLTGWFRINNSKEDRIDPPN